MDNCCQNNYYLAKSLQVLDNLEAKVLSRSNETPEIRLPGQMSPKQMSPGQILQRQMSRHIRLNYTLYG